MQETAAAVEGPDVSVAAGLGNSIEKGDGREGGRRSASGEGGTVAAMGGRGIGEKTSGTSNSTAKEGGAEQSHTGMAREDAVDEELKNNLKQQVLDLTSKVEEVLLLSSPLQNLLF